MSEDGHPFTVHVAIGNSDDRLTQAQWASYHAEVDNLIMALVHGDDAEVHGRWVSPSTDPFQNACWSFTPRAEAWSGVEGIRSYVRKTLGEIAADYEQDTVAWNESVTQFVRGRS